MSNDVDWAGTGFQLYREGKIETGPGGMLKENAGKPLPTLIPTWFLWRLAAHMTKGAQKYARDNWKLGKSQKELDGFRDSAARHFLQWLDGERDEDHMAAVCFNMWAAEYVKENLTDPQAACLATVTDIRTKLGRS